MMREVNIRGRILLKDTPPMAEQFETFREVGIALDGVKGQLDWNAKLFGGVFAFAALLTVGAYGLLFSKADRLEELTARMDQRLTTIESSLAKIANDTSATRASVSDVQTKIAQTNPTQAERFSAGTVAIITRLAPAIDLSQASGWDSNLTAVRKSLSMLPGELQANVKDDCSRAIRDKAISEYAALVVCTAATTN